MSDDQVFEYKPAAFGWSRVVVQSNGVSLTPYRREGGTPFPTKRVGFAQVESVILYDRTGKRSTFSQLSLKPRNGETLSVGCSMSRTGAKAGDGKTHYAAVAAALRQLSVAQPDLKVKVSGKNVAFIVGFIISIVLAIALAGLFDGQWKASSWVLLAIILVGAGFNLSQSGIFRKTRKISLATAIRGVETLGAAL